MNTNNIIGTNNKIIFILSNGHKKEYSNLNEVNELLKQSNINILGDRNTIILSTESEEKIPNVLSNKGLNIAIVGNDNLVKLGKVSCKFIPQLGAKGLSIIVGNVDDEWTDPDSNRHSNNCKVILGDNISVCGACLYVQENSSHIKIGDNTMLSWGIDIWCTDAHTITNLEGNPINYGKSIEIGNHVWIGRDVKIGKNTKISDNSIVGWNSLVTKKFEEPNIIIAGNPAKIVKTGVNWNSRCLSSYESYIKTNGER